MEKLNEADTVTEAALPGGLSLWKWGEADARWTMIKDQSEKGYHASGPPAKPGTYPGQIVKQPSVRD